MLFLRTGKKEECVIEPKKVRLVNCLLKNIGSFVSQKKIGKKMRSNRSLIFIKIGLWKKNVLGKFNILVQSNYLSKK